ncbi:MAG: hypothetical protein KKD90_06640 [Candidatus Omnitrophica bacterium]|nr:hypothetical protein [Candidatus Omnitrophota bacterium]MBU4149789.1 hypothetical protein [Candidatus Omnitrophota bacterium]
MDKVKIALIAAVVVLGIICVAMARNTEAVKSRINSGKEKFNTKILDLETQLAEANKQAGMAIDLQNSLNMAMQQVNQANQQVDQANRQINALVSEKNDLETRLNTAINALQPTSDLEEATSAAE